MGRLSIGTALDRIAGRPPRPEPPRKPGAGFRAFMMFLAPLPLALRAPFQDPSSLLNTLLALGTLLLAAWLTRDGIIAHKEYDARAVARRPAIPRKIFGAVLTGCGLGLASFVGNGMESAALYGLVGAALHLAAFGPDPLADKGTGDAAFQSERIARTIAEAEGHLAAIEAAVAPLRDRLLQDQVASFADSARVMFRRIEEDPRDLVAARRYLGVYLQGAREATTKYVALQAHGPDPKARADYEALLTDLQANFSARGQRLLQNDQTDLMVEIDVLRDRLRREGLTDGTSR